CACRSACCGPGRVRCWRASYASRTIPKKLRNLMDTLTHALSGALVGRVFAGRRASAGAAAAAPAAGRVQPPVWQMVAAGTIAAIFPDLDFVLGWVSELTYLRGHRGVTHSLLLLPLWGLLIAWLLARFWQ